jgi:hypothetical protein
MQAAAGYRASIHIATVGVVEMKKSNENQIK